MQQKKSPGGKPGGQNCSDRLLPTGADFIKGGQTPDRRVTRDAAPRTRWYLRMLKVQILQFDRMIRARLVASNDVARVADISRKE